MYIKVKVLPSANRESFRQISEDHFEAAVKEPAERNLANTRVLELVREHFGSGKKVRIVSGHHSASKILSVE